ncbi:MAG: DUF5010 domain-containing protein [Myxococcota bacterium]|jgi:hypothetical protein|nr:DUF5010 domain-containing protein [Myxococcota bacterium]
MKSTFFFGVSLVGCFGLLCCLGCEAVDDLENGLDEDSLERATSVGLYQAEKFTAQSGCQIATNQAGYTGTGFVDYGDNGTWIEMNNVNVSQAGSYTLKFRYAASSSSRQCAVIVNGANVGNVAFSATGSWTTWGTASLTKSLKAGNNTIRISANTSSGGPNLDSMEVLSESSGTGSCVEAAENKTVTLSCPSGKTIANIAFASYGLPTGACPGGFTQGTCHASSSLDKVKAACLNKASCSVAASNAVFGDPCSGQFKKLAVVYTCSGGTSGDNCPNDPNKTEPGLCGCGVPETPNCGQSGVVNAEDVKFVKPSNNGGPVVSPIFGYNWTEGRTADRLEEGKNWYEWPIYDHSEGQKIMDRNTPEYWDTFVDELLLARTTVISFHHRGAVIGDMHVSHLKKFFEACDRAGVRNMFKISYFEDTGMHGSNLKYSSNGATGSKVDCGNVKHQEYVYLDYYKLFFDTVPKDMWYTHNGRPVISAWNLLDAGFTNRSKASEMLNYCANRFEKDFGVKPLWILQQNWFEQDSRFNNASYVLGKHDWKSKYSKEYYTYRTFNNYKTGVLAPGYKQEIGSVVDGETYEMPRWVNGKNMTQVAFEDGKDAEMILLEGWTNLVESAGFYRSDKWKQPTEYINLVRHYADPEPASLRFQAEGADAFSDTTSNNTFGEYSKRGLDVDRYEIKDSSGKLTDSGWYVDDVKSGEWLEYKNVEVGSGTYRFTARIATSGSGKKLKLELPGASVIELPNTNGKFQLVHLGQFNLSKGNHNLKMSFLTSDGLKVDWFFMKKSN